MVRRGNDRELHLYPELAHIPVRERAQIIRSAPTVGRARRTGLLSVTYTTREGQLQSRWDRHFKCKVNGCAFSSKSTVRAYLRQLGIAIVDEHDRRILAGHGRGALVCNVSHDIELEQLPAPQLPPPRPLMPDTQPAMQLLLPGDEDEDAMEEEAGAEGGEAGAEGPDGASEGATDGAGEAEPGVEVTSEGESAGEAAEGVGAEGLLLLGRGTASEGESVSAAGGAAEGSEGESMSAAGGAADGGAEEGSEGESIMSAADGAADGEVAEGSEGESMSAAGGGADGGAAEGSEGEQAPAEQEAAHVNEGSGNAFFQARSPSLTLDLNEDVSEPDELATWLTLRQATVARSAEVARQTCIRGMMIQDFVETLNFRLQYQIIKRAKNPEVQADLKGILDVVNTFQTNMGDEISIERVQ